MAGYGRKIPKALYKKRLAERQPKKYKSAVAAGERKSFEAKAREAREVNFKKTYRGRATFAQVFGVHDIACCILEKFRPHELEESARNLLCVCRESYRAVLPSFFDIVKD